MQPHEMKEILDALLDRLDIGLAAPPAGTVIMDPAVESHRP
jgi:hypothetical protein